MMVIELRTHLLCFFAVIVKNLCLIRRSSLFSLMKSGSGGSHFDTDPVMQIRKLKFLRKFSVNKHTQRLTVLYSHLVHHSFLRVSAPRLRSYPNGGPSNATAFGGLPTWVSGELS